MALITGYLVKTSNVAEFFNAIRAAKAPERFTNKFLSDLEFKSSNDRLFVSVLKGLGFLDESGIPQQRYFDFLDQTNSGRVLAEAIEEAYGDLFSLRRDAQNMESKEIKGKFKSLTQGQKSDAVINNMTATFIALCEEADWQKLKVQDVPEIDGSEEDDERNSDEQIPPDTQNVPGEIREDLKKLQLHYNIQLILPNSRDEAVFDALFTSLKKHLL